MAEFATFDDLKTIGRQVDKRAIYAKARRPPTTTTVFLSHSSKDADLLPAVIHILENHGSRVYVDLNDNRLPDRPSAETGRILRDTIRVCRKLVLFVTTNSKDSRWAPWELGAGEGEKTAANVCLFPCAEQASEQRWAGQEYLGLYDRIVWGVFRGEAKSQWLVLNHHENSAVGLAAWLSR